MFLSGRLNTSCIILVDFYQTTRRHIPGDSQRYENFSVMLSDSVHVIENWFGAGLS